MKLEEVFTKMGIPEADQAALLADGAKVELYAEAIDKTHVTRLNAANDTTITGAAVKLATDKLNKSHSDTMVTIGKSVDVAIDPNYFTKDGIFDHVAFNSKATTDLGTATTTLKDANNGDADEKYKALEATNLKIAGERDTFQKNLLFKTDELDSEKTRNQESEKQTKINGLFSKTFSDIKFDEGENDLTIEAIQGRILKGAKHGLDENGEYTVTKLDGNSFMNESETKALTPEEVHLKFAVEAEAKIIMNGVKPSKAPTPTPTPDTTPTPTKDTPQFNQDVSDDIAAHVKELELATA